MGKFCSITRKAGNQYSQLHFTVYGASEVSPHVKLDGDFVCRDIIIILHVKVQRLQATDKFICACISRLPHNSLHPTSNQC